VVIQEIFVSFRGVHHHIRRVTDKSRRRLHRAAPASSPPTKPCIALGYPPDNHRRGRKYLTELGTRQAGTSMSRRAGGAEERGAKNGGGYRLLLGLHIAWLSARD